MADAQGKGALERLAEEAQNEPVSAKDRVIGSLVALTFVSLCLGTWLNPELVSLDVSRFSGRGGRSIALVANLIWSRPCGTLAGLLGLMMGWGVLTRKTSAAKSVLAEPSSE